MMFCMNEEIFGLVVLVVKFKIVDEVIECVNNILYGLVVYIFMKDIS